MAYQEGDCNVPLDISNPLVIEWQQQFVRKAAADGYDAMACDNYQPSSNCRGCGVYRAGQWVQLYADADRDPKYTADAITWLRNFTALAHTVKSWAGKPMQVIPNSGGIPPTDVWSVPDAILNEQGFTDWGNPHDRCLKSESHAFSQECQQ